MDKIMEVLNEFAKKHGIFLEVEGEVGFGRECVGFTSGNSYIDYNPYDKRTYEPIKRFYNEKHYEISPENAYHKHDCLCVLGRGESALKELAQWVEDLEKLNVRVSEYYTGAIGIQAVFDGGIKGYTLVID